MEKILTFQGKYDFLSNFFPAPIVWDHVEWPTVEHAYQAAKSLNLRVKERIRNLPKARDAKKAGRTIKVRPDWDSVKVPIMEQLVLLKFQQNPDLLAKLKATGDAVIEEGNYWNDVFWGICPIGSNNGRNELGKILMNVRAIL